MSAAAAPSYAALQAALRPGPRLRELDVWVLTGGTSTEREVALRSGAAVCAALRETVGGPGPRNVEEVVIEPGGRWRVGREALNPGAALDRATPDTLVFLALHGGEGEGGVVQGLLQSAGLPFTGADTSASALCLDKHATRLALADAGLAVAPGRLVRAREWADRRGPVEAELAGLSSVGWSVKPRRGGSSVGASLVTEAAGLGDAVDAAFEAERAARAGAGDDVLVEARVVGTEATCGAVGLETAVPLAFPPVEILPRDGGWFDYRQKYDGEHGAREVSPPTGLDEAVCAELARGACLAHEVMACGSYSRTDFIVPEDDPERPVVLEVNTLPGLTARSLLPLSAGAAGLSFEALCLGLIHLALERHALGGRA